MRSLDILGNNIGEEQANNLIQILDGSDTLTTLCGFTGTETELDLSSRNLSASCAILVANEVKFNSPMMKLTWSTYDRHFKVVANVIVDATQTELDLSRKGMAAHDAQLVAAMLPKCR